MILAVHSLKGKMKKILLVANIRYTVTHFRGELLAELRRLGHDVRIVCPLGKDLDGAVVAEDSVIPLYLERKGLNPKEDLKTMFQLFQIFRKEKPDIVMNFTIKPVIYGSLVAGLFTKAKIYSNLTGLGYVFTDSSRKARILRQVVIFLYRTALRFNDRVFFQNPDDQMLFTDLGIVKKEKTKRLFGSGISLTRFLPSKEISKVPQSFIFVGRLLRDKGILELIQAMRLVKQKFPQAQCFVIGERDNNNPNSFSQAEIEAIEKEGCVQLLGRINDVRPYLAKSQVMVLPSYREGTPRSVLEAMASGLPIITTDAPGCRETVQENVNGFLVPVQDHKILAEKMMSFLSNPSQVEIMGQASLQRARDLFDVDKVNAEILKTMEINR